MTDSEITTTILRQIRDEIIATRSELSGTNQRLDVTNDRLFLPEQAMTGMADKPAAGKQ